MVVLWCQINIPKDYIIYTLNIFILVSEKDRGIGQRKNDIFYLFFLQLLSNHSSIHLREIMLSCFILLFIMLSCCVFNLIPI
jgi:hypothetical protein